MQILGTWLPCADGIARPVVRVAVEGIAGLSHHDDFLIDTGADATVLSAALLLRLQLPPQPPSAGLALQGISGNSPFVAVSTVLVFTRDDGGIARVQGQFAAFTDPAASDLSILGRDVLNHFHLIVSRPLHEIRLLVGNHRYVVQTS
jgi:gag-polyprotein putative aspartyl protease